MQLLTLTEVLEISTTEAVVQRYFVKKVFFLLENFAKFTGKQQNLFLIKL